MRTVPLNQLRFGHEAEEDDINVRRTDRDVGLAELTASVRSHGLINPLTVRPGGRNVYFVAAGNRRLAALRSLEADGHIKPNEPIAVILIPHGRSAREIGLAENVVRVPLHEADQYVAFRQLEADGLDASDIAGRFGIEPIRVRRILALGSLAPVILEAWRAGTFPSGWASDIVRAFTLAPSIEDQERVFAELSGRTRSWSGYEVRQAFGAGHGNAGLLVTFVGADAYRAAGGHLTEDLFGTSHILSDPALAKRLADEKLRSECARLLDEGWSWAALDRDVADAYSWERLPAGGGPTEAETARRDELQRIVDESEDEDAVDDAEAELEEIEAEIRRRAFTEADRARAGCIVGIDHKGALKVTFGIVKASGRRPPRDVSASTATAARRPPGPSTAMVHRLSVQMTLAVQRALPASPRVGLAALLAGAIAGGQGPVRVTLAGYAAPAPLADGRESFASAFERLQAMPLDRLIEVAAEVAARSIDLQCFNGADAWQSQAATVASLEGAIDADALAASLRETFDAADYFAGVAKPLVLGAITDALGAEAARRAGGLPKADLVAYAVAHVPGTGWLPPELRPPAYDGPAADRPGAAAAFAEAAE